MKVIRYAVAVLISLKDLVRERAPWWVCYHCKLFRYVPGLYSSGDDVWRPLCRRCTDVYISTSTLNTTEQVS